MKKLTMQILAESLKLSRVTIWKVLNGKGGVAPETAERVHKAVALFQEEHKEIFVAPNAKPKQITVIMRRVETSMFWMSIIDQLAVDLNKQKIGLNYLPYSASHPFSPEAFLTAPSAKTNGIIVVNIYDTELLAKLSRVPLPKVFYDTAPQLGVADLQGDLLLIDGRAAVERVTADLIQKGRKRLGFIGDIHYARTNRMRYDGFLSACEKSRVKPDPAFSFTKPLSDNPETDVADYLHSLAELPDALVCVNDYTAFIVLNLLRKMDPKALERVIITGFDDSKEFMLEYANITTVRVQKSMLGRRLINQLLYRIENPEADYEEILIQPKVIFR
ncbi:MAG: LacI family DNA-binding transcriptional regulator [Clostridiales bacterium]|jgi:LacI family transcriptional regulator|nr:LacI family DNA-binding transcriptional regulator [Clostridiales bacterium]